MSSECTNSAISSASSSSRSGLISSLVSNENDRDVNHSRKSKDKENFGQKERISEKTNSDNDDDEVFLQNCDTESELVDSSEGDEPLIKRSRLHKTTNKEKSKKRLQKKETRNRAPAKFLNSWMRIDNFKDWLQSRYNSRAKMNTAYCTVCNTYMQDWKQQLDRHCRTPKHKAAFDETVKSSKQKKLMEGFTGQSLDRKVVESEVRLCTLIGEQNLPFSFVDPLVSVLKKSFPEDPTLAKVQLGKQKCGSIIRGVGSYLGQTLKERVKGKHLGVIIDETTDLSVQSQLGVVLQYFDIDEFRPVIPRQRLGLSSQHCQIIRNYPFAQS